MLRGVKGTRAGGLREWWHSSPWGTLALLGVRGLLCLAVLSACEAGESEEATREIETLNAPPLTVAPAVRRARAARSRLSNGLRNHDSQSVLLRQQLLRCNARPVLTRGCLERALARYEAYIARLQTQAKAIYRPSQPVPCRRAVRHLEEAMIRIGLVWRVAVFATLGEPDQVAQALRTLVRATSFFDSAVSRTRAQCPPPL